MNHEVSEVWSARLCVKWLASTRIIPLYTTWGSALGRLAQWAHIFLFSYFFGLWAVGFFALTRRVVQNPLNIIAGSYGQVFYQRISRDRKRRVTAKRKFYMKNLASSLDRRCRCSDGGHVVQLLTQRRLWVLYLDEKWAESIDFLKILVFWYALELSSLVRCLSSTTSFRNKKQMLVLDALHLIMICSAIFLSYRCRQRCFAPLLNGL